MGELASLSKVLEGVEIGRDPRDFLSFLTKNLPKALGQPEGVLEVSYEGEPGVLVTGARGGCRYEVLVVASRTPRYRVVAFGKGAKGEARRIASVVERLICTFASGGDRGTVYFVLVPGHSPIPAKSGSRLLRLLHKLLLGNLVFVFAVSIMISYAVYIAVGPSLTPWVLVALQVPLVLLSPYLIAALMSDWRLDSRRGTVYIVSVSMELEDYWRLLEEVFEPRRHEIKRRMYEALESGAVDEGYVKSLLSRYGIPPNSYELSVRRVDLYRVVSEVASEFGLRTPVVYLSNVILPNAAAMGVYPLTHAVLVTTGLIVRLNDGELRAVIGHEMSHVKNRDVLLLFLLGALEYLTRVYMLTRVLAPASPVLSSVYAFLSLTAFFLAAKVVEARADIESAVRTGSPLALASALRKLAATRLRVEEPGLWRAMAWLAWDPHPPLLFRIEALERVAREGASSPWARALELCLKDLARSVVGGAGLGR